VTVGATKQHHQSSEMIEDIKLRIFGSGTCVQKRLALTFWSVKFVPSVYRFSFLHSFPQQQWILRIAHVTIQLENFAHSSFVVHLAL